MRVMTILGTRPEIIRLSLIIAKLDQLAEKHVLVHTGQNFSPSLSGIFFEEMEVRSPDYTLSSGKQTLGSQLSAIFGEIEQVLLKEKPDVVLLLGDTNSALCAIVAERMGIPVLHMEAGNRCYDLKVPEEKNRRIIDAVSTINMPYTSYSKSNLLREGAPAERIVQTGNPINEVLNHYMPRIEASSIMDQLGLTAGQYVIVTAHRAENVDDPARLRSIIDGLNMVADKWELRIVCSVHPRTRSKLEGGVVHTLHPLVELYEPFGFLDFVKLEKYARLAITDSGTVQEECCLFGVPTVTIRDTTERPETVDCGSNVVCGLKPENIAGAAAVMMSLPANWSVPEGYKADHVSDIVVKYVLGGKWDV
ncbi:UDP-N-acetylglucosamine 2-epimerase (non-hydrolysing) [Paenibacillus cellulosilyticus]|uniref:UDP-N-acetylglucosamine 2-epimerase (Non-hydrolysing) n=1 Tax=Paenibacillus cellulosilyticus TaxID=375489 RepID=A0A2V2YZX4_9BACL|nr:UDP-N-acetylglucosamine 2-epimerase (non-hydrolyzing) [Paenibacillus cellulosilyticus]PWW07347.1 UDP-N-acetylglucosamine 2-epimerase (non-hydrolysing) [Paenibacillus cellulosilyticus]QKS44475.1 UDP-N-acetylglucosamine 2-epimerase (non-hydrolyzing) [Paenibacillus cellulosilyticus]